MKCCYHPAYQTALPSGHPFPMSKYPLLKEQLLAEGVLCAEDILAPEPVDMTSIALVHTSGYLGKLQTVGLSPAEQRLLGLPWSAALWERSRLACGGTLLASRCALTEGLAGNLAGGTHHAFADHGEGFCVLNDVAIAISRLRAECAIRRAAVVDLDVHQGNGTAAIFDRVEEVYTFSMHAERNYPRVKERSNLDIALRDGTGDEEYLELLERHLPGVLDSAAPDLAFYVAGVDVAAGDRYGKLSLSDAGICERDRRVIQSIRKRNIPLVIVLGGGYAVTRARTVELHATCFAKRWPTSGAPPIKCGPCAKSPPTDRCQTSSAIRRPEAGRVPD